MFVVLAIFVCAAQASFFNLGGGGGSSGSPVPKIVKIINVDGGSSGGWAPAPAAPSKIIKVLLSSCHVFAMTFRFASISVFTRKGILTFRSKESKL